MSCSDLPVGSGSRFGQAIAVSAMEAASEPTEGQRAGREDVGDGADADECGCPEEHGDQQRRQGEIAVLHALTVVISTDRHERKSAILARKTADLAKGRPFWCWVSR